MKTPETTIKRIIKNALLSLLIFALPVLLMFFTFYLNGEKPWQKKVKAKQEIVQQHANNKH